MIESHMLFLCRILFSEICREVIYAQKGQYVKITSIQLFIKLQLISILCYTSTVERYNSNEQGKITVT